MKTRHTTDYPILALRVIDGDTVEVWIAVTRDVASRYPLRLRGIEGGELGTREGAAAMHYLQTLFMTWRSGEAHVRAHIENRDNHGRLVGDIILSDGSSLCDNCLKSGFYHVRSAYRPDANKQN